MNKLFLAIFFTILVAASPIHSVYSNDNLDSLLERIKQKSQQDKVLHREREARFLRDKINRQELLRQAKQELERLKEINEPLEQEQASNQLVIDNLQSSLDEASAELQDMFAEVRKVAGDVGAVIANSLVSSEMPGRRDKILSLVDSEGLPTTAQLEQLWFVLQQEMTESGKVVTYQADVLDDKGNISKRDIVRLGVFTAFSEGDYLQYSPDSHSLQVLPRQPAGYKRWAKDIESGEIQTLVIDPTRGSLLKVLEQRLSLPERVAQGGTIGYTIILLGCLGLLLAGFLWFRYRAIGTSIQRQLSDIANPVEDNPLGRVLLVGREHTDPDTLDSLLDEAILKETPPLERGVGFIKLLAAVSPLLGLLGTVVGMIATFQAITLYGSGDPKLMAGGISQALVTTVLGLVTAIPLLFMHNLLNYRSNQLLQILDEQSAALLARSREEKGNVF